jgi:methylmalonyl-CoA mutase
MTENLFDAFESVSSKQWKQQIQFELKGADYNDTLVWESPEGIKVKPFYHNDEDVAKFDINTPKNSFSILQNIYVHDVKLSNKRALDTLNRGAESIRFTIENDTVSIEDLMQNLPLEKTNYFFYLPFLSIDFVNHINEFAVKNNADLKILIDPIGQLAKDGNWFKNIEKDFEIINTISEKTSIPFLSINAGIYQKAGGNKVQELA